MKLVKLIFLGSALLFAGNSFADCSTELSAPLLLECIVYEGAEDYEAASNVVENEELSQEAMKIHEEKNRDVQVSSIN